MIFTDYGEVLVLGYRKGLALDFLMTGNTVFFFSQKTDRKIIFPWPF